LPAVYRFGAFEVDLGRRELLKHGTRIRLQEKPFLVLVELLRRPGEVVTREELRRQLWGPGTFVDFDEGVNSAVKRLRACLGDSADKPLYIETVARSGYRFVAPVITPTPKDEDARQQNSTSAVPQEQGLAESESQHGSKGLLDRRSWFQIAVVVGVL